MSSDNSPFPDRTVTAAPATDVSDSTQLGGTAPAPMDRTKFPVVPPDAGDTFGNYQLISEIARGGMGVVYRAKQKGLDRVVALKMILGQADDALRGRLLLEARSAAALDHPNVVPIYDSGEVNDQLYFTMAFIDGPDLKKYAEGRGALPLPEAMRLFGQIVAGVAHAHSKNIIHRDLKPANVLINKDGRPQVTDFGLAKRADSDVQMTQTGQVMGTPAYMAPEQARGKKTVGPPADVYALGGIMYYLLTGRPPFVGETVTDILVMLATEPPQPPREIIADIPPELETICLKCLAKEPEQRYPDAMALAAAIAPLLDRFLPNTLAEFGSSGSGPSFGGKTGPNKPYGLQQTAFKPPTGKSNPWLVGGGVAAAVVAAVAVAAVALSGGKNANSAVAGGNGGVTVTEPTPAVTPGTGTGKPLEMVKPAEMVTPPQMTTPPVSNQPQFTNVSFPARIGKQDFGLAFELIGAGKDKEGVFHLKDGDQVRFRVTPGTDCFLRIWSQDADGQVVQYFPSQFDPDARLSGRVTREMPGVAGGYTITARPSAGGKPERLRVLASTEPMNKVKPDEVIGGQFNLYASNGRTRLFEDLRAFELAAAKRELKLADAELFYIIDKK